MSESPTKAQELYRLGGRNVWNEFMADPRYRHTFWSILFGGVFGNWGNCWCSHQSMVQRMLACRNKIEMKYSLYIALIFISGIIILSGLTGMVVNKMGFQIDHVSGCTSRGREMPETKSYFYLKFSSSFFSVVIH